MEKINQNTIRWNVSRPRSVCIVFFVFTPGVRIQHEYVLGYSRKCTLRENERQLNARFERHNRIWHSYARITSQPLAESMLRITSADFVSIAVNPRRLIDCNGFNSYKYVSHLLIYIIKHPSQQIQLIDSDVYPSLYFFIVYELEYIDRTCISLKLVDTAAFITFDPAQISSSL